MPLFRVKICGVTNLEDAQMVADSGADAIGLNFAQRSSRRVTMEQATPIAAAVEGRLARVGVFVNQTVDEVNEIADRVGLDIVQLHGDESPQFACKVSRPVVKAIAFDERGVERILAYWDEFHSTSRLAKSSKQLLGVLIDASVGGQFGGTGATIDWDRLSGERTHFASIPWALAGGLDDQNVATAIRKVGPAGVDVASGVEVAPGKKDKRKTNEFVRAAVESLGL